MTDRRYELWAEPWEGLPHEEGAWEWELTKEEKNGRTKNPPDRRRGWMRWYFFYHKPSCDMVKVSADKDPVSGMWFNPHLSTDQPLS